MSKKGLRGLIALILVLILGLGATIAWGIGSRWGEIKNVKEYFNSWGQNKPIDGEQGDGDNNGVTADKSGGVDLTINDNKVISLMSKAIAPDEFGKYGVLPQSESAFTITATVYDEMGASLDYLQSVTYNLAWVSESNEEISDSITLTQSGTTATFSILKAFSTQIILTCTSDLDTTKTATATIDYVKRPDGLNLEFGSSTASVNLQDGIFNIEMPNVSVGAGDSFYQSPFNLFSSIRLGTGTKEVPVELTAVTYSIKLSDNFKAVCDSLGTPYFTTLHTGVMGNHLSNIPSVKMTEIISNLMGNFLGYAPGRSVMYSAISSTQNQINVTGTIHTNKGDYNFSYYINLNAKAPAVGNITLDKTEIYV